MEKNLKNKPVYWFSNIFLKKKNKLKKFLNKKKIQTRDIFYPIHRQPCYLKNKMIIRKKSNYSISDKIYSTGLSLPSSYSLTSKEQKFVIDTIKDFFNNKN